MKKLLTFAIGLGLVFTVATTASAISPSDYTNGDAAGGIADSRHNLGAYGVHFRADNTMDVGSTKAGTTEICIFCHTPHHGSTNAPLWNKGTQSTSYTAYGTTIADGLVNDGDIGAATLACLSCHDGVNTFDTLVNAPGKGSAGTDSDNGTVASDMGWVFTEDGNTMGDTMTSGRLNLGTNLTNDHPVSIVYNETVAASLRTSDTNIAGISMATSETGANDESDSATTTSNRWAVDGYINTGATINDLLRDTKVECSSCHDPHFSNKSWDEVENTWGGEGDADGLFLRRVGGNSISGVCRTCHNK